MGFQWFPMVFQRSLVLVFMVFSCFLVVFSSCCPAVSNDFYVVSGFWCFLVPWWATLSIEERLVVLVCLMVVKVVSSASFC